METSDIKRQLLSLVNDERVFIPIAQESFDTVDVDHSGFIDKDEFKKCVIQVAKDLGLGKTDDQYINEVYSKLDLDKSGSIDSNEFKKYVKEVILKIIENMP
jgi:hypothetical protein